jgi:hypothetical protein
LFDNGGKLRSVFGGRGGGGNHRRLKRMGEVDKDSGATLRNKARAFPNRQRVPSHVRRFHRRRKLPASAGKIPAPAQSGASSLPSNSHCIPRQMPRNGLPARAPAARRLASPCCRARPTPRSARPRAARSCPLQQRLQAAWSEQRSRRDDQTPSSPNSGCPRRNRRSRSFRRSHRSPLVLGSMRPSWRSREHATRSARAKALNSASIL